MLLPHHLHRACLLHAHCTSSRQQTNSKQTHHHHHYNTIPSSSPPYTTQTPLHLTPALFTGIPPPSHTFTIEAEIVCACVCVVSAAVHHHSLPASTIPSSPPPLLSLFTSIPHREVADRKVLKRLRVVRDREEDERK